MSLLNVERVQTKLGQVHGPVAAALVRQTVSGGFTIEGIELRGPKVAEWATLDEVTRALERAGVTLANVVLRDH